MTLKTCKDCGLKAHTEDQLQNFVISNPNNHKYGRRPLCNECNNKRRQNKRLEKRISAIKAKGNKCMHCGVEYNGKNAVIFDFHHLIPQEKYKSGTFDMASLAKEAYLKELDKCILLCSNCHRIEHSSHTE